MNAVSAGAITPVVRALEMSEAKAILVRNLVGRIAFQGRNQVEIEPLHYVFSEGSIWGRTSHGMKSEAIAGHYWVAFEVDETNGLFEWRSVVVHGGFHLIGSEERGRWAQALKHVRRLVPAAMKQADPFPQRDLLFRIPVQEITGYESRLPLSNRFRRRS
jgi:uncharacterized protein